MPRKQTRKQELSKNIWNNKLVKIAAKKTLDS